jgi:hypothetical protein
MRCYPLLLLVGVPCGTKSDEFVQWRGVARMLGGTIVGLSTRVRRSASPSSPVTGLRRNAGASWEGVLSYLPRGRTVVPWDECGPSEPA